MLVSLNVKNLALIDAAEVNFGKGLHIMSGETGAGKSIIIGSVNLALGAKADKDIIRNGAEYALVELLFQTDAKEVETLLKEYDLPVEEDGTIIISRKIQPTRSIFKVNGETATAKQVKSLAEYLLDIHGQHEHQSLLRKKKQQEILDDYAWNELQEIYKSYQEAYQMLQMAKQELSENALDEDARLREMELAQYEIREIEAAGIVIGEDEELEKKYQTLLHGRKIVESASVALMTTGSNMDQAGSQIGRALRELTGVASYDDRLETLTAQLGEIDCLLSDFHRELTDYIEDMDFSEEAFAEIENRLNVLNHLKAKYGKSLEKVREYAHERQEQLDKLLDYDTYLNALKAKVQKLNETCMNKALEMSDIRKKAAKKLADELKQALTDLNFLHVELEVAVEREPLLTSSGFDAITFLISTNPGQGLKPLQDVASGGELSRIMLGLKTVLAKDSIDTLIFDEIDAGISGKTAWKVSEKLGLLSKEHQIICITHLPQIAAMADTHFLIEKSVKEGVTTTKLCELSKDERIRELARMLGGGEITDAAMENAKDLLNQSAAFK
ncbi:MAG: DNA repair protein RecN [Lachnospiraceae bacterium]|nr:DNA repair protein RecN [Lachnospiraceae bacterium]